MILAQAVVDIRGNLEAQSSNTIFDLGKFVAGMARFGLFLAALGCFAYFLYGGMKWTFSGGDKGKIEEAQHTITNAIIGLAIVAISFVAFAVIQYLFGVDIVKY